MGGNFFFICITRHDRMEYEGKEIDVSREREKGNPYHQVLEALRIVLVVFFGVIHCMRRGTREIMAKIAAQHYKLQA